MEEKGNDVGFCVPEIMSLIVLSTQSLSGYIGSAITSCGTEKLQRIKTHTLLQSKISFDLYICIVPVLGEEIHGPGAPCITRSELRFTNRCKKLPSCSSATSGRGKGDVFFQCNGLVSLGLEAGYKVEAGGRAKIP